MAHDNSKKVPAKSRPTGKIADTDRPVRGLAERRGAGEPLTVDELVDEASQDSFPASDPPSFMAVNSPGRPRR